MGHQNGDNTKCDIEIGQVPSCAKCCILRIKREEAVAGTNSIQRIYFYGFDCHLEANVLLSPADGNCAEVG